MGSIVLVLSFGGSVTAQTVTVDKNTAYSKRADPITDVNTSSIVLFEVNDQEGDTGLTVYCSEEGKPNIWGVFFGKNQLLPLDTEGDGERLWPDVVVRLGTDTAFTVLDDDLYSTDDPKELAFDGKVFDRMVTGLIAGQKMVIRMSSERFRQPLTYTFNAQGFGKAWNGVKACK